VKLADARQPPLMMAVHRKLRIRRRQLPPTLVPVLDYSSSCVVMCFGMVTRFARFSHLPAAIPAVYIRSRHCPNVAFVEAVAPDHRRIGNLGQPNAT